MTELARPGQFALRPFVAKAWHRAALNGLDPGSPVRESPIIDVNTQSRLMRAARPVLDELAEDLKGSQFSLLLADRHSHIVDRRLGSMRLGGPLDRVLAVVGNQYSEETTGTNALATTFEVRSAISVSGPEHFLESFKDFSCYGHPILDPLSGRLEGVLDVTGFARDTSPLLAPMLARACLDIQARLISDGTSFQHLVLAAYQQRVGRTHAPLLALSDDVNLLNPAASERVSAEAQRALRFGCRDLRPGNSQSVDIDIGQDVRMTFRCTVIARSGGAILCEAIGRDTARAPVPRKSAPVAAGPDCPDAEAGRSATLHSTLITGEHGSGRTHRAYQLAAAHPVVEAVCCEPGAVARLMVGLPCRPEETVVIVEDIHLLSDSDARRLARLMDSSPLRFLLTSGPDPLDGERVALQGRCARIVAVPTLRSRIAEIASIAQEILDRQPQKRPLGRHLAPSALAVLCAQPWPGNIRELETVLSAASEKAVHDTIQLSDLPLSYREAPPLRRLGVLEQAEHDAITRVLVSCSGNKAHAAAELGIGRTTLYRRLRELGISG